MRQKYAHVTLTVSWFDCCNFLLSTSFTLAASKANQTQLQWPISCCSSRSSLWAGEKLSLLSFIAHGDCYINLFCSTSSHNIGLPHLSQLSSVLCIDRYLLNSPSADHHNNQSTHRERPGKMKQGIKSHVQHQDSNSKARGQGPESKEGVGWRPVLSTTALGILVRQGNLQETSNRARFSSYYRSGRMWERALTCWHQWKGCQALLSKLVRRSLVDYPLQGVTYICLVLSCLQRSSDAQETGFFTHTVLQCKVRWI